MKKIAIGSIGFTSAEVSKVLKEVNPMSIFEQGNDKKKQRKLKNKLREQARRQKRLDKLAQK